MTIPAPVIAVVSRLLADAHTHDTLDALFANAGAPGDPPEGSKSVKCRDWLWRINREAPQSALSILGKAVEWFMEEVVRVGPDAGRGALQAVEQREAARETLRETLANAGLAYLPGGRVIVIGAAAAGRHLRGLIRDRDLPSLQAEFDKLAEAVDAHPRDALSTAANIVEAVLGELVAAWNLTPPNKRTLNTLWSTVKHAIRADPATIPDPDIAKVAGAMATMVDGLQGLRDDKSRAHAMRPELARSYRIEPRHARLVVNAALAFTVFLIEAWDAADKRKAGTK